MTYEAFKSGILNIVRKSGEETHVRFRNDKERGRYAAYCSNGVKIFGNSSSLKITVRYGSGHQMMTAI